MATVAGSATGSDKNSTKNSVNSPSRSTISAKQPSRFLISDLCALLESYLSTEQVKKIYSAYLFSAEMHMKVKHVYPANPISIILFR